MFDLLLNPESGRYFFRMLAAKLILENPEKYGFGIPLAMPARKWINYVLKDSIPDLPWWCRNRGFSYKCFRLLNPWIRSNFVRIPYGKSELQIRLPIDCRQYTEMPLPILPAVDSIRTHNQRVETNLVLKKDISGFQNSEEHFVRDTLFHLVKKGENLSLIALRYGITVSTLIELNPELASRRGEVKADSRLIVQYR
jgi:hypothetical protein